MGDLHKLGKVGTMPAMTFDRLDTGKVRFHRNGCGGNGFYTVPFRYDLRSMVGVVFDEPGNVSVLDRADVSETWRGDRFETALRLAIAEAIEDGTAYQA